MREAIERVLEREGQTIFLQWVRAIIALAVIGTAIYVEVVGEDLSEAFVMLLGFVAGLYFEKGSMVVKDPPSSPSDHA